MSAIVILALVVTLVALMVRRSALAMMGAMVIVGGEILANTGLFSTFSTIILIGCAQLLMFVWCKSQHFNNKNEHTFTALTLACSVLSACKLSVYMLVANIHVHNAIQGVIEGFLALNTILMAFTLLWTPTRTVALHEYKHGRNAWSALFDHGHSHNIGRHKGE